MIKQSDQSETTGVPMSIGVAQTGPVEFVGPEVLLQNADKQMYRVEEKARTSPGHHVSPTGPRRVTETVAPG